MRKSLFFPADERLRVKDARGERTTENEGNFMDGDSLANPVGVWRDGRGVFGIGSFAERVRSLFDRVVFFRISTSVKGGKRIKIFGQNAQTVFLCKSPFADKLHIICAQAGFLQEKNGNLRTKRTKKRAKNIQNETT